MTPADIETLIATVLADIAPDADLGRVDRKAPLREELDIDSMDFLKLVQGLHERLSVAIPEADYAKVSTLDGMVGYLAARVQGR